MISIHELKPTKIVVVKVLSLENVEIINKFFLIMKNVTDHYVLFMGKKTPRRFFITLRNK